MSGKKIYILFTILFVSYMGYCQPDLPQRTISVAATQMLGFGDITITAGSSGGTVTVDYNGSRTQTGSVVLLNMGHIAQQAVYEIKLCPGRLITISYPSEVTLTGSNGGTLKLHPGSTSVGGNGDTFISNKGCDERHYVMQGGTLDVGSISANPGGRYTGSFVINFIQQ